MSVPQLVDQPAPPRYSPGETVICRTTGLPLEVVTQAEAKRRECYFGLEADDGSHMFLSAPREWEADPLDGVIAPAALAPGRAVRILDHRKPGSSLYGLRLGRLSGKVGVVVPTELIDPIFRDAAELMGVGVWLRLSDGTLRFVPLTHVDPLASVSAEPITDADVPY